MHRGHRLPTLLVSLLSLVASEGSLLQQVHAAEEGLEASAIRRGGAEMRALGLNHL